MINSDRIAIFALLTAAFLCGCANKDPVPPPPPQITINSLENNVYQFQYDNGQVLDMGEFMIFLDGWMKANANLTIKSVIPQMTVDNLSDGTRRNHVHGVMVFCDVKKQEILKKETK